MEDVCSHGPLENALGWEGANVCLKSIRNLLFPVHLGRSKTGTCRAQPSGIVYMYL